MKKILIFFLLGVLIILSGCTANNKILENNLTDNSQNNTNTKTIEVNKNEGINKVIIEKKQNNNNGNLREEVRTEINKMITTNNTKTIVNPIINTSTNTMDDIESIIKAKFN